MIDTFQRTLPDGVTLGCRATGAPGRPLMLFLHGFPEGAFVWDELMAHFALPEHGGYRCVAPDLRGYGGTSAPPEPSSYTVFHIVGDLVALLDALRLPQVRYPRSIPPSS